MAPVLEGLLTKGYDYIAILTLYLMILKWQCLLTPTSGGNKSQENAIDTDSVAIRATKQLLTPTSVPAFLPTALLQAIIQSPIQDARQAVSAARV